MHLLSENGLWKTESEFITPEGNITKATGESKIELHNGIIYNHSFVILKNEKICNDYEIKKKKENHYVYESRNPGLGIQIGTFDIDRNIIYSKFIIENTKYNGFEIIERVDRNCFAHGALYEGTSLINTWRAKMTKSYG